MARFARFHTSEHQRPEDRIVINPTLVRSAQRSGGFIQLSCGLGHATSVYGDLDDVLEELNAALNETVSN